MPGRCIRRFYLNGRQGGQGPYYEPVPAAVTLYPFYKAAVCGDIDSVQE